MSLPPVDPLAYGGMGVVALFALWKLQVAPRVERLRERRHAPA